MASVTSVNGKRQPLKQVQEVQTQPKATSFGAKPFKTKQIYNDFPEKPKVAKKNAVTISTQTESERCPHCTTIIFTAYDGSAKAITGSVGSTSADEVTSSIANELSQASDEVADVEKAERKVEMAEGLRKDGVEMAKTEMAEDLHKDGGDIIKSNENRAAKDEVTEAPDVDSEIEDDAVSLGLSVSETIEYYKVLAEQRGKALDRALKDVDWIRVHYNRLKEEYDCVLTDAADLARAVLDSNSYSSDEEIINSELEDAPED